MQEEKEGEGKEGGGRGSKFWTYHVSLRMTGPEFPYLSVYQAEASIDFQVFF